MEALLNSLGEGVYMVDTDRRVIFWNAAAERITGFSAGEVLGRRCADNILIHVDGAGRELCTGCCPLAATLNDSATRTGRVYLHHKEGHRVAVEVRTIQVVLEDGTRAGAEVFSEAGSREALLEEIGELRRLSLADTLTGLPNRRYLEVALSSGLAALKRNGVPFGVLFMDLDRFKDVNDRLGHQAGDAVLASVARTLQGSVRPFDTVGRWGGEEFLGVFPRVTPDNLMELAQRLRKLVAVTEPVFQGEPVRVTVSIGAAMARPDDDEDSLVKRADRLMYESKSLGGNRVAAG
jgi:diguanylate cyclase (GGDEF)-like protein/PAS domain S-box-containing protein